MRRRSLPALGCAAVAVVAASLSLRSSPAPSPPAPRAPPADAPLPAPRTGGGGEPASVVTRSAPHPVVSAALRSAAAAAAQQQVRFAQQVSGLAQDVPAALRVLAALYHAPVFDDPQHAMTFHPLVASGDRRLGPLALARYRTYRARGGDSWVEMDLVLPLIARHGGRPGITLLKRLLRGNALRSEAWASLAFSPDRAALDLALGALERSMEWVALGSDEVGPVVTALCKRWGDPAFDAFERIGDRPQAPESIRVGIVQGLVAASSPGRLEQLLWGETHSATRFLSIADAAGHLETLTPGQTDFLRARVTELLADPLHGPAACGVVRDNPLYKTVPIREALEALLEKMTDPERSRRLHRTLSEVKRFLQSQPYVWRD